LGLAVCVRPVPFEGEARHAAEVLLEDAVCVAREARAPLCYVATGETTVTVTGHGRGGRNQELALAAALLLAERHIRGTLVSVGSDGIDGPTDVAGAFADETTLSRATARGLSAARRALDDNDSHSFFAALGDTIRTGPTRTNVGDLVIILLA
jgi:hydroxypyruvate reductase